MNRKFAVVTTFHEGKFTEYGRKMIDSFCYFWPKEVDLYVYVEGTIPQNDVENVHYINLLSSCPNLVKFKAKYKNDPIANGKGKGQSAFGHKRPNKIKSKWQGKDTYLFDAVRFSHKSFCQIHAAQNIDADVMIWLDADTITFAKVTQELLESLLPIDHYVSYLGRPGKYTECGFMAYDLRNPNNIEFMKSWEEFYITDKIFSLGEWHDCEVFDKVRERMEQEGKIKNHNLNVNKVSAHPFVNSILGTFMDHLKGGRKSAGRSYRADLKVKRTEDYWK